MSTKNDSDTKKISFSLWDISFYKKLTRKGRGLLVMIILVGESELIILETSEGKAGIVTGEIPNENFYSWDNKKVFKGLHTSKPIKVVLLNIHYAFSSSLMKFDKELYQHHSPYKHYDMELIISCSENF